MVLLAVNNENLCGLVKRAPGRSCRDMEAVDLQVEAAKDMEPYIDGRSGGAGRRGSGQRSPTGRHLLG